MRILHVAEIIRGGIASFLDEAVPDQAARLGGAAVRLLVPAEQAADLERVDPALVSTFSRPRRGTGALLSLTANLARSLRRFEPDIVHAHSSLAGMVVRVASPLLSPRCRIVYSPQCFAFMRHGPGAKRTALAWAERALAPLTDAIVAASEHELEAARSLGISERRLHLVRNGIHDRPEPDTEQPPRSDTRHLLFIGRFDRQKGFDTLIAAMEQLRDAPVRLLAAGGFVTEAAAMPLPENVEALGWLPRSALEHHLATCDAVVMPSRWEALPFAAIEAMRAGKPLIATDAGGLRELVIDGETGILVPIDAPDLLAERIANADRPLLSRLGAAARRRFLERYDARIMNDDLIALYRQITRQPSDDGPQRAQ